MGATRTTTYNPTEPTITNMAGNELYVYGQTSCELFYLSSEWKLKDIMMYLLNFGSKDSIIKQIKKLCGRWIKDAILGIIAPYVKNFDGQSYAWELKDCKRADNAMENFLTALVEQYFYADELENNITDNFDSLNPDENEIIAVGIGNIKSVFDNWNIRSKVPMLSTLSDKAYDMFCMKVVSEKVEFAVALLHYVKLDEFNQSYAKANPQFRHAPIFDSYNQFYDMVVEAIGKSNRDNIKGQFEVLRNPNNSNKAKRCLSYQYTEDARKFFISIEHK